MISIREIRSPIPLPVSSPRHPYSYTMTAAGSLTPKGDKFDEAAVRREAYDFFFLDTWKATVRLSVNYGLRYEVNSRIHEAKHRTSLAIPIGPNGQPADFLTPGTKQIYLYNPQPPTPWTGTDGARASLWTTA